MPTFNLAGQLRFTASLTDTMSTTDVVDSVTILQSLTLADGDGTGEANAYWRDVRTVAANTQDTINLGNLPLSIFGGSSTLNLNAAKTRLLYVRNLSTTVNLGLVFDGDVIPISAGAVMLFLWPADPETGSGDFLDATGGDLIVNNDTATAADYEIVIVGVKST
jgi:hypothetical protein